MRFTTTLNPILIAAIMLTPGLVPSRAGAQGRGDRPTGAEIAQKAKKVKLNPAKAVTAERGGKRIKFTPVDATASGRSAAASARGHAIVNAGYTYPISEANLPQTGDLSGGQVIGQLDTTQAGDETPLDPGVYNVMVAQVNGVWSGYVESNGEVVGEYTEVDVAAASADQNTTITPDWDLKTIVPAAGSTGSYGGGARAVAASWPGNDAGPQTSGLSAVTINKLKGLLYSAAASNPLDKVLSAAARTPSGLEIKTTTALAPAETKVEAQVPDATGAIKQIVLNLKPSATDPRKVIADYAGQPADIVSKLNDPFADIRFAVKNTVNNTASTSFKTTLVKKK